MSDTPAPITTSASDPGVLDDLDNDQPVRWKPETIGHASWLARLVREATADLDAICDLFDAELSDIQKRKKTACTRLQRRITWAEGLLVEYAQAKGVERLDLPHGSVVASLTPVAVDAVDPAAAERWLRANNLEELVKTETSVRIGELKKLALMPVSTMDKAKVVAMGGADSEVLVAVVDRETGEVDTRIVPGVRAVRRVTWKVK